MANEFSLEDRVTKLEEVEKNRKLNDVYIVVELMPAGVSNDLNRVATYGPFIGDNDAQKFTELFSYSRSTLGLKVCKLQNP